MTTERAKTLLDGAEKNLDKLQKSLERHTVRLEKHLDKMRKCSWLGLPEKSDSYDFDAIEDILKNVKWDNNPRKSAGT